MKIDKRFAEEFGPEWPLPRPRWLRFLKRLLLAAVIAVSVSYIVLLSALELVSDAGIVPKW